MLLLPNPLCITNTVLYYISQVRPVPDARRIPLGLVYSRSTLGRAVPVPHRYYLCFGNLCICIILTLGVRLTIKPLPLPTSALVEVHSNSDTHHNLPIGPSSVSPNFQNS